VVEDDSGDLEEFEEIVDEDLAEDDTDTEDLLEEIDDNVEVVDVLVEDESDDDLEEVEDDGELEEIDEDELVEEVVEDDSGDLEEFEEIVVEDRDDFDAPFDSFMDDALMNDNTLTDPERKRLLAERFDRYLGEMEKHYNQYLLIPGGEYIIGAQNARKNERPIQKITISDIYFGRFPVTNALFEVFVDRTGYKTTAEECGFGIVYQGRFQKTKDEITGQKRYVWNATTLWEKREGAFWYQPAGPGTNLHRKRNHPVVQVSFKDAMAFASWVGKRLPSEVEWEAVARTAQGDLYPWGNEWKEGVSNTEESEISDTVPVDNFPDVKNTFGLSDLLGNTLEWTSGRWEGPTGSVNHQDFRIVKGGSWVSNQEVKLYTQFKYPADFTANILGFRCLVD
jgi:formylglycine-generating enzyme required for sulfatase activity